MKQLLYILVALLFLSCKSKNKITTVTSADTLKIDNVNNDSVKVLTYQLNIKDTNITNTSNRRVDILFNGIDRFLGGKKDWDIGFETECMVCEPVQIFGNGLLFGKCLVIDTNAIKYYKTCFNLPDTQAVVKVIDSYGEHKRINFVFKEGKGSMKYARPSCDDADYVNVKLTYKDGTIEINNLLNASFFEYDMNKDGTPEQYLLGTRNCSQELAIVRITK